MRVTKGRKRIRRRRDDKWHRWSEVVAMWIVKREKKRKKIKKLRNPFNDDFARGEIARTTIVKSKFKANRDRKLTPVVTFFFISPLLFFFFSSSFFFFCSYFCFPPFDTLFSPRCFFLFSRVSHVINHIHEIHAINVFFFFFMFLSGWREERKNYCKVYYFDIKLFLLFLLHYWILNSLEKIIKL